MSLSQCRASNNPCDIGVSPARHAALSDNLWKRGAPPPRLGMAYQVIQRPNWDTVIRGGFGTFYDLGSGSLGGASSYFPYNISNNFFTVPFPLSPQNAAPPALTVNPPVGIINIANPNLKLPRSYQWNVALEQSLGGSQSLSIMYIGATGRDLLRVTDLSNPNPNFHSVGITDNSATSDYNALQLKFERRLSRGLQALASSTFSHSIDNASTDAFANYLNTPAALGNPNIDRGDSDFDIRHSFTAGVTYNLPAPGSDKVVQAVFGDWSLDSFVVARSAPPVDIVGAQIFVDGVTVMPRPDVMSGVYSCALWSAISWGQGVQSSSIYSSTCRAAGRFRAQCPAGVRGLASRFCVAKAVLSDREVWASFPIRVLQHIQPPKLRQPQQHPWQPTVWPIYADAGEQPRLRRCQWRLQPPVPNRRPAFDPASS